MSESKSTHKINSLMNTYNRLPVAFTRGEGIWLYDTEGKKYLDALSGIAVCGLGHSHPKVTAAIQQQAQQLLHTSNSYHIPAQQKLADELTSVSGLQNCFFSNSGAEANETAIKLARLYGHRKGIATPQIIVMEKSFHGRTLATLSASGNRKIQAGFEPLVTGFLRAPFNNIDALKQIAEHNADVVAVLVEPIQGEGGVRTPADNYLTELSQLCDEYGWLLMLDEVQTGNGRTGKFFAYQHELTKPDVVTTAKGLGNGIPIGVCMAGEKAAELFSAGNHASTFGGNPFACTVGLTVVQTLFNEGLIENAAKMGERMLQRLKDQLEGAEYIQAIRGKGLMLGIELTQPCIALAALAQAKGLLINVTSDTVIRLLPPLVITEAEADTIVDDVCKLIKAYVGCDRKKPR